VLREIEEHISKEDERGPLQDDVWPGRLGWWRMEMGVGYDLPRGSPGMASALPSPVQAAPVAWVILHSPHSPNTSSRGSAREGWRGEAALEGERMRKGRVTGWKEEREGGLEEKRREQYIGNN
jgi:hypothetical protein